MDQMTLSFTALTNRKNLRNRWFLRMPRGVGSGEWGVGKKKSEE
jgi:hypothetical protein